MNNEEKEAIEEAKKQIKEAHNLNDLNVFMTDSTTLKTLLNLIDKLQKENEELKEEIKDLIEENHKHIDYIANMKKKHEDKIRTKIKELKEDEEFYREQDRMYEFESKIKMLKELLEDN